MLVSLLIFVFIFQINYCTIRISNLFAVPVFLDTGCLPTKLSIFNHYLQTRDDGVKTGKWKSNTSLSEISKVISDDINILWGKTAIPTLFFLQHKKSS